MINGQGFAQPATGTNAMSGMFAVRAETDRVLALDSINSDIVSNNLALGECFQELRAIADSAFGENPSAQGKDPSPTPVNGRLGGMHRNVSDTRVIINAIREQIERLHAL